MLSAIVIVAMAIDVCTIPIANSACFVGDAAPPASRQMLN
jgi:hypothetical protein